MTFWLNSIAILEPFDKKGNNFLTNSNGPYLAISAQDVGTVSSTNINVVGLKYTETNYLMFDVYFRISSQDVVQYVQANPNAAAVDTIIRWKPVTCLLVMDEPTTGYFPSGRIMTVYKGYEASERTTTLFAIFTFDFVTGYEVTNVNLVEFETPWSSLDNYAALPIDTSTIVRDTTDARIYQSQIDQNYYYLVG